METAKSIKMEMKNVTKVFPGVKALDNVNFKLKKGTTHVLCGENGAGKSTLMKILDGIFHPDEGEIFIDGKKVLITNPIQAKKNGIAMIFQELLFVPDLTVAENIYLGDWPIKNKLHNIDWKKINKDAAELLQREGVNYSPETKMKDLSISDIQMIEIVKALSHNAEIIIMDEPTSAITIKEIERLFNKIKELGKKEVSFIYISHKMDEVFRIADEISVMRDGVLVETRAAKDFTVNEVIEKMVGRKMENHYPKKEVEIGEKILEVENLSKDDVFRDISFYARKGEIVGFSGLMGAGRTEVMRALFGLDAYDEGIIKIHGEETKIKKVKQSIGKGMVMVSEDRMRLGIIPIRSVKENASLSSLEKIIYHGRLHKKTEKRIVTDVFNKMNVKTPSLDTAIENLSGGNQQKVILARWMIRDPDILILDEPTRGIDVGAKYEIYNLITTLAKEGKGIVIVSSELTELIGMCDRIYVMRKGTISGMLKRKDFTQENIMKMAVKAN